MSRHRAERRIPWRPLAVVAATVLAIIAIVTLLVPHVTHHGAEGVDLRGKPVAFDAGATPAPTIAKRMAVRSSGGDTFDVPSVGLDVPLDSLAMVDQTITPPGFTAAYRVRNLGVAPSDAASGTVYVAMHSLRGGAIGPGNYLIDVAKQRAKIAIGAKIEVAGLDYTVATSAGIAKGAIGSDASIWSNVPGRLVVITCLQKPGGGPSSDNMVITATLDHATGEGGAEQ